MSRRPPRRVRIALPVAAILAAISGGCGPETPKAPAPPQRVYVSNETSGTVAVIDPVTGTPVWHTHIGDVTNPPMTYMLDGRQYILVATTDTLYAFALYQ